MKKTEHIMVALDGRETDDTLLQFANGLSKALGVTRLTSAHVVPVLLVGGIIKFAVGEILKPVSPALGRIQKELETKTNKYVDLDDLEILIKLVEGRPYEELLKLLEESEVDLLLMGKKKTTSGSGITAKRIARHAKSDLLFVPENSRMDIKRILVATDFSEHAARASGRAIALLRGLSEGASLECLFVVDVPTLTNEKGIGEYTKMEAEVPEKMKLAFAKLLSEHQINNKSIECSFIKTDEHNIAKTLRNYARDQKIDLIVMGAKGHSAIERFLVGSVTEAMVDSDFEIPVYVVR